jgi:hypothetical protein
VRSKRTCLYERAAPNPEESYSQLERKEVVSAAIGGLQPGARRVVEFHKLQELSARRDRADSRGFDHSGKVTDVSCESRPPRNALD